MTQLMLDEAPVGYASFNEVQTPAGREEEARKLVHSCWLNEAACALKREEWHAAAKARAVHV